MLCIYVMKLLSGRSKSLKRQGVRCKGVGADRFIFSQLKFKVGAGAQPCRYCGNVSAQHF